MANPHYIDPVQRAFVALLDGLPLGTRLKSAPHIELVAEKLGVKYDLAADKRAKKIPRTTYWATVSGRTHKGLTLEEAANIARLTPHSLCGFLNRRGGVYSCTINNIEEKVSQPCTIQRKAIDCTPDELQAMREAGWV